MSTWVTINLMQVNYGWAE